MLIGNNNNFNNNNFATKFKAVNENNANTNNFNNQQKTNFNAKPENKYTDVNNSSEMIDKSLQMLQNRLDNGLITLEEFNSKCNQINKLRKK